MPTYIEYVHARPEFDEVLFELSKANGFTASDLAANRLGHVGMDQTQKHLSDALVPPLLLLAAGVAISFVTRVAFAGYVEKKGIFDFVSLLILKLVTLDFRKFGEMYLTTSGERLPMITALFVITAPMSAYKKLRRLPVRLFFDLARHHAAREEGAVYTLSEEKKAPGRAGKRGDTVQFYYYLVNEKRIKVTAEGFHAVAPGLRYKVYYLPFSKTLLSIEPIIG